MSVSSLKKKLKESIPMLSWLTEKKKYINCWKNVTRMTRRYKDRYLKYSTSLTDTGNPLLQRRLIIINSHIIEKGLSHTDYKPGFGRQTIEELQRNLILYMQTDCPDQFAITNAISLLFQYHRQNEECGFDDCGYLNLEQFKDCTTREAIPYSLKRLTAEPSEFRRIAENRHSVRSYEKDGLPIDRKLFEEIVSLANTAPSACNRQATRLFIAADKDLVLEIEKIHGGCKDFGRHVSAFVFVTSDLSLYSSNEAKIPAFDAGIYTMNLLYALQAYGFYTCTLNGSFPGEGSEAIRRATKIPDQYEIQGLVAVYCLPDSVEVKIAASPKREGWEVLSFLE